MEKGRKKVFQEQIAIVPVWEHLGVFFPVYG